MANSKTILAADDEEGWRGLIELWLRGSGYTVYTAANARDILPLAEKVKPDAFVLDYDLGDGLGSEVCKALKARPEFAKTPVIIWTTMAGEMLKIAAEAKPNHFVVKNESPDELFAVLETLLA